MAITRAQQVRQMLRDGTNYNPSEIVSVPKEFKARKNSPNTKLAYITKDEEKLLKKLKPGTPHKGPEGIPNYDSFDISGGYTSGRDIDDRTGEARDPNQRFSGGNKQQEKETRERNLRNLAAAEKAQKERLAQQKAIREKEERQKRIREEELKRQKELKEKRSKTGFDTTTKFGTPTAVRPGSPDIRGLKKIELAKSAIEDDDDDDVATAKAIAEQNPFEKFLGNFKPPSVSLLEGITSMIPGRSLSEMYEKYGKTDKFKSRFPGIDSFEDYEKAVSAGMISAKGGPMGDYRYGGVDSKGNPIFTNRGGGQDQPIIPIVPTTTGIASATTGTTGTTGTTAASDTSDLDDYIAQMREGAAYRFFADGGRADGVLDKVGLIDDNYVGGIMDLETSRQMYGLGKLVKKVTRGVKKIVKSPIGKAALLYAGAGGLGNLAAGKGFSGMFSGFMSPSKFLSRVPGIFTKGGLQNIASRIGLGKFENVGGNRIFKGINPLLAITGASALAGLMTPKEQEEEEQYLGPTIDIPGIRKNPYAAMGETYRFYADGGKAEPVAKKTMPLLDMDGMEKDYRADGGFVPIGRMERADDVPARLSKNEFVFTADAVRNAGDGDVDKGAEVMYNMMKNLEAGGNVSEESQGLDGARKMFQTSQRLEEVL